MVTGSSAIDDAINAVNKGTDGYILKPVKPKKLVELIENLLKEKSTREIRDWIKYKKTNKNPTNGLERIDNPKNTPKNPW